VTVTVVDLLVFVVDRLVVVGIYSTFVFFPPPYSAFTFTFSVTVPSQFVFFLLISNAQFASPLVSISSSQVPFVFR
jgi:hypothetical protein